MQKPQPRWLAALLAIAGLCCAPQVAHAESESPSPVSAADCGTTAAYDWRAWGFVVVEAYYPRQSLLARSRPAAYLRHSDLAMLQKGFVPIGSLEVTRYSEFVPPRQPEEPAGIPATALAAALDEAARRGGDALTLFGAQEQVSNFGAPRPPGIPADVVRGTKVAGSIWRHAPGASRPQLLIYAAQYGRADVVKGLLAERVTVNAREPRFCMTALIAAAQGLHSEVVGLLITAGAKLELSDVYGRTALGWAAYIDQGKPKHCQSAQLLRRAGAHEPKPPTPSPNPMDFPGPSFCAR